MERRARLVAVAFASIGWLLHFAAPVAAHTDLLSAEPAAGSVNGRTPSAVELMFTEPLEGELSTATIERQRGEFIGAGRVDPEASRVIRLAVPNRLESGVYRVRYRAMGVDGHPVDGSFLFAVWPPGAPAPDGIGDLDEVREASGAGRLGVARGVQVVGAMTLAGLVLGAVVLGRLPAPRRRRVVVGAGVVVVVGDLLAVLWAMSPADAFRTTVGRAALVSLVLATAIVVLDRRADRARSDGRLALVTACGLLLVLAATGHAGAVAEGRVTSVAIDWIHLVAAALWVGGLLDLLLRAGGPDGVLARARRWRNPALLSAAVVIGTGVYNTSLRLPGLDAFLTSGYGRTLVVKLGAVVAVLVLAVRVSMRVRSGLQEGLRAAMGAEAAGFAVVGVAVAVLASLAPPPPPPPAPVVPFAEAALLGNGLHPVVITPYRPGRNTLTIFPDAGAEEVLSEVDGHLERSSGNRRIDLRPIESGGWRADIDLPPEEVTVVLTGGGRTWRRPLWTVSADPQIRLGTVVSLDGPRGAECRGRLIGQMAAVIDAVAAGESVELVALHAHGDVAGSVRRLAEAGVHALAGGCGTDDAAFVDAARSHDLRVFGGPGDARPTWGGEPDPERIGELFGRFLADNDAKLIVVFGDGSRRSTRFTSGVRVALGEHGSVVAMTEEPVSAAASREPDAVVVAGGWEQADRVLDEHRRDGWTPVRGVFLAPWHLSGTLLEPGPGERAGGQVSVGLHLDPGSPSALRYTSLIGRTAPTEVPSSVGLAGYVEARLAIATLLADGGRRSALRALELEARSANLELDGGSVPRMKPIVQFFTPALFQWLPTELSPPGSHGEHRWFENGALSPVSQTIGDAG